MKENSYDSYDSYSDQGVTMTPTEDGGEDYADDEADEIRGQIEDLRIQEVEALRRRSYARGRGRGSFRGRINRYRGFGGGGPGGLRPFNQPKPWNNGGAVNAVQKNNENRSEEHTSELQSQ